MVIDWMAKIELPQRLVKNAMKRDSVGKERLGV
jgi:hypothetical protein